MGWSAASRDGERSGKTPSAAKKLLLSKCVDTQADCVDTTSYWLQNWLLGGTGHMRGECPELKKKLIKKKFAYKKPRTMMATWSDEDEDEEITCLMARSDDTNQ
ncbi:hypothetical protein Taro_040644, partial [Colocasia esculenta]|nr:hypothetical protein [Colocasia esculenta]